MNWAAVAAAPVAPAAPADSGDTPKPRVAVVDANALITQHGLLNLARFADKAVTTPEVLREVRDKQSRATLAALPFTIETQEPDEEQVKAVVKFARATGDIHALSTADVRLIALARAFEVAAHGDSSLHELPQLPKVQKKKVHDAKQLPGWGVEGGDWAEIDRLNEEELAAAEAALAGGESRISSAVAALSLEDAVAEAAAARGEAPPGEGSEGEGSSEEEDDDGEWETAAKSNASARRQRRRAARKAAWEARQAAAAAAAAADEPQQNGSSPGGQEGEQGEEQDEGDYSDADACSLASDDDATAATAAPAGGEGEQPAAAGEQSEQQGESSVCIITADFAMQNVIMQMGLRLVTPDGRRITRLSRWVLRCTACFLVTKEMGRLFCPRCGNATLDKVQLVVGPDGAEQYGVRRKHILRGTRFSLPKPKGGRHSDLILREDQLLAKAHRLRARKKEKEELDPFAPEYGEDTWHKAAGMHYGNKGAAALLAGWKNNPNERKHIATNRRRK